jgi:hypothetical protein
MFTIPLSAKLGLGAAAGLMLLGAATPAVSAMTPLAAVTASPSPTATGGAAGTAKDKSDRRLIAGIYLSASAQVLGISVADLRADLRAGKSLGDLAQAKGLTKAAFADLVGKAMKPALDAAVDAHKLTRAQADRFEARLAKGHVPLWDRHRRAPTARPSPAA